jgi:prepilin-type N-terminal cleavage/methylation domain-containing protein
MKRTGYSLVEALVAISISSVLASVALGLLGALVRADHSGRRHLNETQSLARLAGQLRADIGAAEEASLADGRARLLLRLPGGGSVEYAAEPGRATREERLGDVSQLHEQFLLPEAAWLQFAVDDDSRAGVAVASLAPETNEGGSEEIKGARLGWRVEAAIGRAMRLTRKLSGSNADSSTGKEETRP